jgi:DNA-binding response OmpR family regulator
MDPRQHILIVTRTPSFANTLFTNLDAEGYGVTLVTTFTAAKVHLDAEPDLVITELKLAEYNGLHLALRARAKGIPAIVIGEHDAVLEHDAEQLGARYLSKSDLRPGDVLAMVHEVVAADTPRRRSDTRVAWFTRPDISENTLSWGAASTGDAWSNGHRANRRVVLH